MLRTPTRAFSKTVLDRASVSVLFTFLFFVLVSPQFAYVQAGTQQQGFAQPAYANFLGDQQGGQGIAFEQLLWDASTPIVSYKVEKGNKIEDIAKDFWTTVRALQKANGLSADDVLQQGQTIKIAYDDGIVYAMEKVQTIEDFAAQYQLNLVDVMSLNYITDPKQQLQLGDELFLDLNAGEAEKKWLIKKKEYKEVYVPMDLPEDKYADSYVAAVVNGDTQHTNDAVNVDASEPTQEPQPTQEVEQQVVFQQAEGQKVITPQDAKKKEEAKTPENALKSVAQPAKDTAKTIAQKPAVTQEPAKKEVKVELKPEIKAQVEEKLAPAPEGLTCPDNACQYQWKCVKKPENAFCVEPTPDRAWTCKEGFREEWHTCVDEATRQKQQKEKEAASEKWWIISSTYVSAKSTAFKGGGFAGGHCTWFVAKVRWEQGDPVTRRGNANQWLRNAAADGRPTGKTPTVWSIVVFSAGPNGWAGFGHVAVVTAVGDGQIRVREMNYKWRRIETTRWVPIAGSGISGYIY